MASGDGGSRSTKTKGRAGISSPSQSVEVASPSPMRFVCDPLDPCENFKIRGAISSGSSGGSSDKSGSKGSSFPGESETKSSGQAKTNSSASTGSRSLSARDLIQGMETKEWGGVDQETDARCKHGKRPRRLLCWDGKNTGRRYLACPLRGIENRCDFIQWKDGKWPPMFQSVASSLWEVADKFKKKADDAHIDLLGAMQMRNDAITEKEALMEEKEQWDREKVNLITEKERLERELTLSTALARTTCDTLENRIKSDSHDKKMLYGFVMCLIGVIVALLFGVLLTKEK